MIKGLIHQENIRLLGFYVVNKSYSKYMNKIDTTEKRQGQLYWRLQYSSLSNQKIK